MKLFAVYVGGIFGEMVSNIELHDMRFSVGETIEDCFDDLKKQWWGNPDSLHLDAWGAIEHVDGYDISLKKEPYTGEEKLYFINLGGYAKDQFTELHSNIFVVAPSESKAKVKALKTILDWDSHHKDNLFEIENSLCLNDIQNQYGLHIHLEESNDNKPFSFEARYVPIGGMYEND